MKRFKCWNGPAPTTAAQASVTTGTVIRTMLQISTPSTNQLTLISWGFTLSAPPATTSTGIIELLQTDVAATTGTAHVAAGLQPLDPGAPASLMTLGTSNTGYTFTVEGTTTASRVFDVVEVPGLTAGGTAPGRDGYQWMPDERPIIGASKFLRVRVTFGAAVNLRCWVVFDE